MNINTTYFSSAILFILCMCSCSHTNDLCNRIGVCTSINNAQIVKNAGGSYLEISIRKFLNPNQSDTEFEANYNNVKTAVLPPLTGNSFFPKEIKLVGPNANKEQSLKFAEIAMKRASMIGTKIFVLGSGGSRYIPEGYDRKKAEIQFIDFCKDLAVLGGKYNVLIVIEPLCKAETNYINTVREGLKIVRAVNHPNLGVLADFYHMAVEGEGPDAIIEAGSSLRHCHIAEKEGRTAPGVKGDDFTPYLKALKAINYQGYISLECRWNVFGDEVAPAIAELKRQIKLVY